MSEPAESSANDALGGILLILVTIAALVIANTALNQVYHQLLLLPVEIRVGDFHLAKPFVLWINDGLMALFFCAVGLEIKSELMEGALSTREKALLPLAAAIGGMAAPAAIYAFVAWNDPASLRGWAIPAATDIAFAIGILGLMRRQAPPALRAFLLALAVLDDLGAIVIIALFYTADLSGLALMLAVFFILVLAVMNRLNLTRVSAYLLVGTALWLCVLKSGVHATLAGVITALFIPMRDAEGASPLYKLAEDLQSPVNFAIVPLFAFANAGVLLGGLGLSDLASPVTSGIILGLIFGKPIGIVAACALTITLGAGRLPDGLSWGHLLAAGCLAGIGFTMSLFIGTLAFDTTKIMNDIRLGVLVGSSISAALGILILHGLAKAKR